MPPPDRPCGRTASAPKCRSWASEVMKQSVSSPVARSRAPITSSPSLSEITSHSSRAEDLRVDPLDDTLSGAEREARPVGGQRRERQRPLAGVEGEHLAERQPALEVGVVRARGQRRQVEDAELEQPAAGGEHADLAARGGTDRGDDDVVVGAGTALAGVLVAARPGQQAARGQVGEARVVGHLEGYGGRRHGGAARLQQHRPAGRAVGLGHVGQLVGDDLPAQLLVVEDRVELLDLAAQRLLLLLELDPAEPGEPAQRHLEDVVGLGLGEVEDRDQPFAGGAGVVAGADHLDDLVDVEHRDQQAVDEVQPVGLLVAAELRAPAYDLEPVLEEDLEHLD